jgi:hypothetical protein
VHLVLADFESIADGAHDCPQRQPPDTGSNRCGGGESAYRPNTTIGPLSRDYVDVRTTSTWSAVIPSLIALEADFLLGYHDATRAT